MSLDDPLCYCFHISRRKILNFCRRERPSVPSQISECGGAGTGCGWCIPFLRKIHAEVMRGEFQSDLDSLPATEYAAARLRYHAETGRRPPEATP